MENHSSTLEKTQERTPRVNSENLTGYGLTHSIDALIENHGFYVEKQHDNESSEVSSSEYNDQVHDYTENSNVYQEIAQQFSSEIKPAPKITYQRQWKEEDNQDQEKQQGMHEYRKEEFVSETGENNRNRYKRQPQHSKDSEIRKNERKRQSQNREGLMKRDRKQENKFKKQISKSRQSVQFSSLMAISPSKTSRKILSPEFQFSIQKRKQVRSAHETRRQKEYKSIEEECRKCEKFFQMLGEKESDTKTASALRKKKDLMQKIRHDLRKYRIQRRERFQQDLWTDEMIFEIRSILEGKIQKEEELMRYIERHGTDSYSNSEVRLFFQQTESLILNFDEMDRRIEQNQSLGVLSVENLCAKEAEEAQNKDEIIEDDDRELVQRLNARNQAKHQEEIQRLKSQIDELTASNAKMAELYTAKQKQVETLKEVVKDQQQKCTEYQREYEARIQELSRLLLLKEEQNKAMEKKLMEKVKEFKQEIDKLIEQANARTRKHEEAMQELRKDLQIITSKCQDEVRHEKAQRIKAEQSHKLREDQLKNNLIQIENQFQRMVTEHQSRVQELNDEIERQTEQHATLKELSDQNIQRLNDEIKKQRSEKEKLRSDHEQQKAKLMQGQIKELKEKIVKQKAQINQLNKKTQELYIKHRSQLEKAQSKFQKKIQEQKNSHKKEIEGKNRELQDMQKKLDDQGANLELNRKQLLQLRQNNSPKYIKINLIDQTSENVHVVDGALNQNSRSLENHNEQSFSLRLSGSNRTNRSRQIDRLRVNQIMESS